MAEEGRLLQRWSTLDWRSPRAVFPHGLSGAAVVAAGAFFLGQALFAGPAGDPPSWWGYDATGPQPRPLFHLFVAACAANAIAGMMIANKAPRAYRLPFLVGGATQLSLAWFAFRFSLESTREYSVVGSLLDKFFGLALVFVNVMFFYMTLSFPDSMMNKRTPFVFKLPILCGAYAFSLTCFYPFQLAWFGNEWFACVLDEYPYQRAGFVSYVYIPTLLASACIWFGVTLFVRKIMPAGLAAAAFFLFVLGTLVATVLAQEIHISEVSTQKLILLCRRNESLDDGSNASSWLAWAANALDTSSLARNVLQALGIPLHPPPTV